LVEQTFTKKEEEGEEEEVKLVSLLLFKEKI